MDISNKTLAMFLVAAIVASLAGTMISLNKIGGLGYGPTGFATNATDTGNVSITVESSVAISLGESDIIFTGCTTHPSLNITVDSTGTGVPGNCSSLVPNTPYSGITIFNDGNVPANVTFNVSDVGVADGGTFLPAGNAIYNYSRIYYNIVDTGNNDVCGGTVMVGGLEGTWRAISGIGTEYSVCDSFDITNQDLSFHVQINIPPTATTTKSDMDVTFIACQSGDPVCAIV